MAKNHFDNMALQRELDVSTKVSNLEKRAGQLERDFNEMLLAAREMEIAVKKYVRKAETDRKSWELLEKLNDSKANMNEVLDHVRIFFSFVLAKLKLHRVEIIDVKMLWHLIDCEGIGQCFSDVIIQCGFARDDLENMKTLAALVAKMQEELERTGPVLENTDEYVCNSSEHRDKESVAMKDNEDAASQEKMRTLHEDIQKDNLQARAGDLCCKHSPVEIFSNDIDKTIDRTTHVRYEIPNEGTHLHSEDVGLQSEEIKSEIQEAENKSSLSIPGSSKYLKNIKHQSESVREALKRVRFLDIEDDMKKLIRKIVCYVTKIMCE